MSGEVGNMSVGERITHREWGVGIIVELRPDLNGAFVRFDLNQKIKWVYTSEVTGYKYKTSTEKYKSDKLNNAGFRGWKAIAGIFVIVALPVFIANIASKETQSNTVEWPTAPVNSSIIGASTNSAPPSNYTTDPFISIMTIVSEFREQYRTCRSEAACTELRFQRAERFRASVPSRRFDNIPVRKIRESTTQDGTLWVQFSTGENASIKNCIWVFDDSVTRNIRRGSNLWSQVLVTV